MPCATYDRTGKLTAVLAGPGETPDPAKIESAVTDPDTKFIVICSCEDAHHGIADASTCDTIYEDQVMVLRPDETPEIAADHRPRRRRTR